MRYAFIGAGILLLEKTAWACPACVVSSPERNSVQTFWILSVMGILPIVVAVLVGMYITRVQKYDKA